MKDESIKNDGPVINLWYGDEQKFGHLGTPQRWVNVLGNISGKSRFFDAKYSLNGSEFRKLPIGPDGRRLNRHGDFNINLPLKVLKNGENKIVIEVKDIPGGYVKKELTLLYSPGNLWPLPTAVDWSRCENLLECAQVVDGLWKLENGEVRTVEVGYDRLIALGDIFWKDFEVTVPVTIHSFDESAHGLPNSVHSAVGMVLRFAGHACWDGSDPCFGYAPSGAIAWYSYIPELDDYRITFMAGADMSVEFMGIEPTGRKLSPGVRHIFKARVESRENKTSIYHLKVWREGNKEPEKWDTGITGVLGELTHGCVLLVAHHCDASFGNVIVTPL
ncbi:MAG: hypothetical protein FIA99_18840 [Ruminiclostridium sp.]|nr:hypothetical protein [Ruminiclostridium sp.]